MNTPPSIITQCLALISFNLNNVLVQNNKNKIILNNEDPDKAFLKNSFLGVEHFKNFYELFIEIVISMNSFIQIMNCMNSFMEIIILLNGVIEIITAEWD